MVPESCLKVIVEWAESEPLIGAVYLFGSRVKGTARPDSDLDIAARLTSPPDREIADWSFEADRWRRHLQARIDWTVDLQDCHPVGAPHVFSYLRKRSILVYEDPRKWAKP